jgi:mannonate dehydratase
MDNDKQELLEESFRWYGPNDPVSLRYIRQAGASSVFSALHHIPYGEVWSRNEIQKRREFIEESGLKWRVVESLPVHEHIKAGEEGLTELFENYRKSLRNLAQEGLKIVVYNFMPVLDWVRTDIRYILPDGSECLRFDPIQFAAFELFALKRPGIEESYTEQQVALAGQWWASISEYKRNAFIQSIIDIFPGHKMGLNLEAIRSMLQRYKGVDEDVLQNNLCRFLEEVIPTAEEVGIRMAVHPDDPPFPILGLPRIISTQSQIEKVFSKVNSPANGLCFCSGFKANS